MKTNNLTIKKLGELSGIQHRTIEGWFSAKRQTPRLEAAVSIAKVLNVSVEYLVTGIDPSDIELSPVRKAFMEFIEISSDEELQKMWDFFELMRGRK